jgi:hypothetical protein
MHVLTLLIKTWPAIPLTSSKRSLLTMEQAAIKTRDKKLLHMRDELKKLSEANNILFNQVHTSQRPCNTLVTPW